MFEKERFIEDCRAALKEGNTHAPIRGLVATAVSEPCTYWGPWRAAGCRRRDDLQGRRFDYFHLCWGPWMKFKPHDHRMWAVIGIYGGREQNTFCRRAEHSLEQHGSKELHAKDTTPLGAAIIHAVTNPLDQITAAIHVYGGDFFATPRSEWDPKTFEERPYDVEDTMRAFEAANERLRGKVPRS